MNRHRIFTHLIQWSVPFLNLFRRPKAWPYPFDQLEDFEKGSLGRELFLFLNCRGLTYLPKYEEHDAYHVLLGYGTTVTEELKLQAFMWGNRHSTFAGSVLFVLGYLVFPGKRSILNREIERGRSALQLSNVDIVTAIPLNLLALRAKLCIDRFH